MMEDQRLLLCQVLSTLQQPRPSRAPGWWACPSLSRDPMTSSSLLLLLLLTTMTTTMTVTPEKVHR